MLSSLRITFFSETKAMNQHSSKHSAQHKHDHKPQRRPPHKDWRVWVVVGLMLAAIAVYVLSQDESFQPGGNVQQPVPADAP